MLERDWLKTGCIKYLTTNVSAEVHFFLAGVEKAEQTYSACFSLINLKIPTNTESPNPFALDNGMIASHGEYDTRL